MNAEREIHHIARLLLKQSFGVKIDNHYQIYGKNLWGNTVDVTVKSLRGARGWAHQEAAKHHLDEIRYRAMGIKLADWHCWSNWRLARASVFSLPNGKIGEEAYEYFWKRTFGLTYEAWEAALNDDSRGLADS